jgi:hypothetical protein
MASEPGLDHSVGDHVFGFVRGIEYENVAQGGIGDKKTIPVVHRQADNAGEVRVNSVADHGKVAGLGIEDEDGSNLRIGNI